MTRPFHATPQSISEPGPPAALNHAFRRWMRQKMSGQTGSRYQGRPGMGVRMAWELVYAHLKTVGKLTTSIPKQLSA